MNGFVRYCPAQAAQYFSTRRDWQMICLSQLQQYPSTVTLLLSPQSLLWDEAGWAVKGLVECAPGVRPGTQGREKSSLKGQNVKVEGEKWIKKREGGIL